MNKQNSSIVVGVATHKPYRMPKDPMYMPLHVGAILHPDVCVEMQSDAEGDGISELNSTYSELTGLYWLWKNCSADYKGLVHYRRLLASSKTQKGRNDDPYQRVVGSVELGELLDRCPVVVAKRRNYYIDTVYDHYAHTFDASHFDECRNVLVGACPEYVPSWDKLMSSRGAHIWNMFVMREDLFNAYCSWMFGVIGELAARIDSTGLDAFQARWPGRVSERLLDPWLETNGIAYSELPVVSPEPIDWIAKGKGFLAAKFLGKKYERSF